MKKRIVNVINKLEKMKVKNSSVYFNSENEELKEYSTLVFCDLCNVIGMLESMVDFDEE